METYNRPSKQANKVLPRNKTRKIQHKKWIHGFARSNSPINRITSRIAQIENYASLDNEHTSSYI